MNQLFNDGLQEYEIQDINTLINIDGGTGSNIIIGGSSNILNIDDFMELKLEDGAFNLYFKNENPNGNIFIKNDNVDNKIKIEDGVLYVFYDYNPLTSLLIPSGWTEVADYIVGTYQGTLNNAGAIAGVQGQTLALQSQIGLVSTAVFALEGTVVSHEGRIVALEFRDSVISSSEILATRTTNLTNLTNAIANLGESFFNQLINVNSISSLLIVLSTRGGALYTIGVATAFGSTIGSVIALGAFIADTVYKSENYNKLNKIAKSLETLESNPNKDVVNVIHIDGLSIDPTTKTGYLTTGDYEITIINDAKILIQILNGEASILMITKTTDNFTAPSTILIPVSQVGGNNGFPNLIINVNTVYSLVQILILESTKVLNEDKAIDNRQRRRQLIPNRDDFGDGINITESTDTLESGEELPKIDISLKVDLDDFYFDSGILKTLKVSFYKLDGLSNRDAINASWAQVVKDIKNNTYPNREIMKNVYTYHANRLIGIKPTKTSINAQNAGTIKTLNTLSFEEMVKNIFFEMTEITTYWNEQFKSKPADPADLIVNKMNNFFLPFGFPTIPPPADFSIPNGIFIVDDMNGYGVRLFIELTNGIISNKFLIDYGGDTIPNGTAINFIFGEIGGYTGTTPFFTVTAILGDTITYYLTNPVYSNALIDKIIGNQRHRSGILTNRTFVNSINPDNGLKQVNNTQYDDFSGQNVTSINFKVNINLNDFYIMEDGTKEIALNLVNKINTSLLYNANTRKIGVNPNVALLCSGIESTGNINNFGYDIITDDINCSNITSYGNFTNQGFNLLTQDIQCRNISSLGDLSCVNITCDTITKSGDLITEGNLDIGDLKCSNITSYGDITTEDIYGSNLILTDNIKCNKIRIGAVPNQPVFNLHVKCEAGTFEGLHLDASTSVANNGFEHCFSLNAFNTANANKAFGFRILNPGLDFNSMSFNPDGSVEVALAFSAGTIGCVGAMSVGGNISHLGNLNTKIIDCTNLNSKGDVYVYSANESSSIALRFGTPFTGSYTGITKSAIIAEALQSWSRHNLHFCLNTTANNTDVATINDSFMSLRNDGYIYMNKSVGINGAPDSTTKLLVNGNSLITGTLKVNSTSRFEADATFTKDVYIEDVLYVNDAIVCDYHISGRFFSVGSSGTDKLGIQAEPSSGTNSAQLIIRVISGSFTEFHRCYINDALFNLENADVFKNDYVGRIVVSTGKIKTDYTTYDDKNEPIWGSKIDKDGITIEDALPIVQLSRKAKDKTVYGVLGDPARNTNNPERLIVNAVGEGGICVANTNGNVENGDYICSSSLLGYGERQDDDLLHNYTVAKVVMDCTFELDSPYYQCYEIADGVRVAFLACVYYCG